MPCLVAGSVVAAGVPCPAAGATAATAVQAVQPTSGDEAARSEKPQKLVTHHLPNAIQIHSKVISGGLPEGEEAFQELVELGVHTIISVDGMQPDVETAQKLGLRYVHLPHGYDGISESRLKQLAKAVRDLDGLIYIHCHHGKHRSPVAASAACVAAGMIPASAAPTILETAGTSPGYRGLFRTALSVQPMDPTILDELRVQFRPSVEVPPMAHAMVQIEQIHGRLKLAGKRGWRDADADPEPAHDALLLREQFTELLRSPEVGKQKAEFRRLLEDSEAAAVELEAALRESKAGSDRSHLPPQKHFDRISTTCVKCHETFRDTPIDEKP